MALQVAGWGLLYGDFFDLYHVAEVLGIPSSLAAELMLYLRKLQCVDVVAENRKGLKEAGKASKRIYIKVLCIRPGPPLRLVKIPPPLKSEPIQQQLTRLVRLMPSPRGSR